MKCPLCKLSHKASEFIGIYCGRCDKITGDVMADLADELEERSFISPKAK